MTSPRTTVASTSVESCSTAISRPRPWPSRPPSSRLRGHVRDVPEACPVRGGCARSPGLLSYRCGVPVVSDHQLATSAARRGRERKPQAARTGSMSSSCGARMPAGPGRPVGPSVDEGRAFGFGSCSTETYSKAALGHGHLTCARPTRCDDASVSGVPIASWASRENPNRAIPWCRSWRPRGRRPG